MQVVINDGGRQAAGYKGHAGDCVARSIAIVTGRPYQEIYDTLANGNASQRKSKRSGRSTGKRSARNGISTSRQWFKDYMRSLGFRWVPTMGIGTGCQVHLNADELPMGRLVVAVSRHYCAVLDRVIHDTYDPSRGTQRCVYGYWIWSGEAKPVSIPTPPRLVRTGRNVRSIHARLKELGVNDYTLSKWDTADPDDPLEYQLEAYTPAGVVWAGHGIHTVIQTGTVEELLRWMVPGLEPCDGEGMGKEHCDFCEEV